MSCRVGVAALFLQCGCAATTPASDPTEAALPTAIPTVHAPAMDELGTVSDASAESTAAAKLPPAVVNSSTSLPTAPPLAEHDYRRVFRGSPLLLHTPHPYLVTTDGAVNLETQTVDLERDGSNGVAFEGDSIWLADRFSPMSACPEPSTLVQKVGNQWVPRLEANVHSLVVRPWVKGSSLAGIVPLRSGPPWGYELTVLERNRTAPRPARRTASQLPECETRIAWFQTLVAFPSGEIYAFGSECENQPLPEEEPPPSSDTVDSNGETNVDEVGVDRNQTEWPPNVMESWHDGRHEFIDVPFRELGQVVGVGPKDLWAVGTRNDETWALAHFDGKVWQLLSEHYDSPITGFRVYAGESGRDARRFVLTTRSLFEMNHGVSREHELPPDCTARGLTLDGEDWWIECFEEDEVALYTTRRDIAEFRFDTSAPERQVVSFTGKAYPRLDPKAPSLRSCHSREFDSPEMFPHFDAGPKPSPHRRKSPSKLEGPSDFGY